MRTQIALRNGWYVRQAEAGEGPLDVEALSGQVLGLREADAAEAGWLSATMPAQVHDVLLSHGLLPDPRVGRNAAECAWVAESDWLYACTFPTPESGGGPTYLRFRGLDTLATASLNGQQIGAFDSMYREYAVDVGAALAPAGERNALLIHFRSPVAHLERLTPADPGAIPRHHWLRKASADFSPDLGVRPHWITVGVYRDVVLDVRDREWIDDLVVRTEVAPDGSRATVRVSAEVSRRQAWLHWSLTDPNGAVVARGDTEAWRPFAIDVPDPMLWWPHTHGLPHLYALSVQLTSEGESCDERLLWVGLREVRLERQNPSTLAPAFRFMVNGRPIFLQGAGWAPVEGTSHCWAPERAGRLLDLAHRGRMNALRVWGEGAVPDEAFYDACDRRGILVWQEFPFGGGPYPEEDPGFMRNARAEAEGLVRRLRNHPSVLLWVGGSECQASGSGASGAPDPEARRLFDEVLPEICSRLDPTRPHHPASPDGGPTPNWPLAGDWHDTTATHTVPWASVPTFASAVGRVSPPAVASLRRFMSDEELWPAGHDPAITAPGQVAWPPMWGYRAADGAWEEVANTEGYCAPRSAEDLVRTLGMAHGEYLRDRIERERRGQRDGAPADARRCGGNLVWRLNDPWPAVSPSLIDDALEPKIAYYFVRRAYAPVLLSFERTADEIHVWVVNDSPLPVRGALHVRRMRFDGTLCAAATMPVDTAPGLAHRRPGATLLGDIAWRHEFLVATLGDVQATCLLAGERYLNLPPATLTARIAGSAVEITTDVYARQVHLAIEGASDALFVDNHVDLIPGETRRIGLLEPVAGRTLTIRALNASPVTLKP